MMPRLVKLFVFFVFLLVLTEGKLDFKCINGKRLEVPIYEFEFGNIYSPGYTEGKAYPNEMNCHITLIASEDKYIRLTYNYIDIVNNLVCREDRLAVLDVFNETHMTTAGMYCGEVRVPDYVSATNKIIISFVTSAVGTGSGFNITYREVSTRDICQPGELQCRSRKCISDQNTRCNGVDDCGDGTDEEDCGPAAVPSDCGIPDVQPYTGHAVLDRIVGGRQVVRGSWPWQVDMQVAYMEPNGHFCGGSLINSEWFITAAHCISTVPKPFLGRIHLGNHHKYKRDPHEVVRYVKDFFVYGVKREEFEKNGIFNISHDLALAKLNAPVPMNQHIKVVCLPELNEELEIGEKCFATGWGVTRGTGSDDALKQAEHPIKDGEKCNTVYQKFEKETMICAGRMEPLNGLCHGDSGGPLVCKKDGRWHVYGAASFVTDSNFVEGLCGIANKPTVFNKIAAKIKWIKDIIANNS